MRPGTGPLITGRTARPACGPLLFRTPAAAGPARTGAIMSLAAFLRACRSIRDDLAEARKLDRAEPRPEPRVARLRARHLPTGGPPAIEKLFAAAVRQAAGDGLLPVLLRPLQDARNMVRSLCEILPCDNSIAEATARLDGALRALGPYADACGRPADAEALAEQLTLAGDKTVVDVYHIARDKSKSAGKRLHEISALDCRYYAWKSPRLGELLGVSAQDVRKTDWWRVDRKKFLAPD
jgi:hypothetical protein